MITVWCVLLCFPQQCSSTYCASQDAEYSSSSMETRPVDDSDRYEVRLPAGDQDFALDRTLPVQPTQPRSARTDGSSDTWESRVDRPSSPPRRAHPNARDLAPVYHETHPYGPGRPPQAGLRGVSPVLPEKGRYERPVSPHTRYAARSLDPPVDMDMQGLTLRGDRRTSFNGHRGDLDDPHDRPIVSIPTISPSRSYAPPLDRYEEHPALYQDRREYPPTLAGNDRGMDRQDTGRENGGRLGERRPSDRGPRGPPPPPAGDEGLASYDGGMASEANGQAMDFPSEHAEASSGSKTLLDRMRLPPSPRAETPAQRPLEARLQSARDANGGPRRGDGERRRGRKRGGRQGGR